MTDPCPSPLDSPAQRHPAAILRRFTLAHAMITPDTGFKTAYAVDGRDGSIVFPASSAFLRSESPTLLIPEPIDDGLHLLVDVEPIDDPRSDAACDRWFAMGIALERSCWARARIETARFEGKIIDATDMAAPNPLHAIEPAFVNACNAERVTFAKALAPLLGEPCPEARIIGVDGWGVDVRVRPGTVFRIAFDQPALTADDALAALHVALGNPSPDPRCVPPPAP
ncbi:MAG: hypothetical protein ACT4PL_03195 [Phycisphaerales bacterium]